MKKNILTLMKVSFIKTMFQYSLVVALLFSPLTHFAQSPVLGSLEDFILFSSNGAVTNSGLSQYTGNVGANNGPISAFGNVNGVIHNQDIASAAGAADLLFLYQQLNFATPTFFPSVLLGNGDTLIAGVYKIFSAASLNDTLYLDGKGNANAVFIIQIQGAFSTAANAKVILINGAQACNVFWKIEGLINMATKTFMRGTMVANNAAIITNALDTLEGRLLTTTGAITINSSWNSIPTGCNNPMLTGPIAPSLGSAACYGLFSGNGSVTNTGVSYISGDVGTNVGLAAGFNPLFVMGTIHSNPDVSTAACASDLQSAYSYINTLPYDIELLYPAQFGNNLILTPHTYLLNAAIAFTDTLLLDAQGNTNGVFVIKINGALSTNAYSRVVLMNGAQDRNVFWQVEGAVSIADHSVFYGTIICNNAAIGLTTGDSIYGRALTTNGALSTVALVSTKPIGNCSPLSKQWLYFTGTPVEKNVLLKWSTINDRNNKFYTIEKSSNGNDYEKLVDVNTFIKSDNTSSSYSSIDDQPYPIGYYRISQTDKWGKQLFFNTIKVDMNSRVGLQVKPYVTENQIYIKVIGAKPERGIIELYSMEGEMLETKEIEFTEAPFIYQLEKPSKKGVYIIYMLNNKEKLYTGKVIVM